MNSYKIFNVRIDLVTIDQVVTQIDDWLKSKTPQHRISTPNIEFLIEARKNIEFGSLLNSFDLNIPDSSHLHWLATQIDSQAPSFPITTGVDLVNELLKLAPERKWIISIYGGSAQSHQLLKQKFPLVNWGFTEEGGQISLSGETQQTLPKTQSDIVLVALGQVKQENWINRYWQQVPGKLYIGVGGSIDYLSGRIKRAPVWMRDLGLEWLYRLVTQPWRISRQFKIVRLVFELLLSRRTSI